uniref:Mitochondrial carrier protein n=1 Tax=Chromera velia CCMP2878 TaxID=1169474 RepID=A0A0G4HNY4_9ALVE|eukprot:Cvel_29625.t1-p1 / transcript=Cvel_29625.t1 / gene=Cvel_29625 / organism=Chromera_velia_CCMP2878 / gene_product=Mitoferrin, putative / transcript_product=Mitoferrin, putative / location=Cvel_scaffold4086:7217-11138(+) / protein_length=536 / sequence_SO=supercontig / SO=protein_coding / is_pseudo=false
MIAQTTIGFEHQPSDTYTHAPPPPNAAKAVSTAKSKSEMSLEDRLDWEEYKGDTPFWEHALAGSAAGVMEHVAVFPLDTIKTRMQALSRAPGASSMRLAAQSVLAEGGVRSLFRGVGAITWGCVPAHAALFSSYEFTKSALGVSADGHYPLRAAVCGAASTFSHDIILTPMDVVKQRLQLGCFRNSFDCLVGIARTEGIQALFRSMPTTLLMNLPYGAVMVAVNESLKEYMGINASWEHGSATSAPSQQQHSSASSSTVTGVSSNLSQIEAKAQAEGRAVSRGDLTLCTDHARQLESEIEREAAERGGGMRGSGPVSVSSSSSSSSSSSASSSSAPLLSPFLRVAEVEERFHRRRNAGGAKPVSVGAATTEPVLVEAESPQAQDRVTHASCCVCMSQHQTALIETQDAPGEFERLPLYFLAAGLSGGVAAAMTTPFDVIKTRLQTQDACVRRETVPRPMRELGCPSSGRCDMRSPVYVDFTSTFRSILRDEGMAGFFRGVSARVALAVPSAAICWGTYETVKWGLHHLNQSEREGR